MTDEQIEALFDRIEEAEESGGYDAFGRAVDRVHDAIEEIEGLYDLSMVDALNALALTVCQREGLRWTWVTIPGAPDPETE